jgi:hypothetical protein
MTPFNHSQRTIMRRRVPICVLLTLWAAGVWGLAGCGNQPGTLEGVVTRATDGTPVAAATVRIYPLTKIQEVTGVNAFRKGDMVDTLVADEDGIYSISLAAGSYVVEVEAEGLATANKMVEVKGGQTTTVDFSLAAPSP